MRVNAFYGIFYGCITSMDSHGRNIVVVDADRGDGKRFVVHADKKLTAFLEVEFSDANVKPAVNSPSQLLRCQ
jgi:hypothetical protein